MKKTAHIWEYKVGINAIANFVYIYVKKLNIYHYNDVAIHPKLESSSVPDLKFPKEVGPIL